MTFPRQTATALAALILVGWLMPALPALCGMGAAFGMTVAAEVGWRRIGRE